MNPQSYSTTLTFYNVKALKKNKVGYMGNKKDTIKLVVSLLSVKVNRYKTYINNGRYIFVQCYMAFLCYHNHNTIHLYNMTNKICVNHSSHVTKDKAQIKQHFLVMI